MAEPIKRVVISEVLAGIAASSGAPVYDVEPVLPRLGGPIEIVSFSQAGDREFIKDKELGRRPVALRQPG